MKNEKFCFNKSVGVMILAVVALGAFAFGAVQLTQKPTSTSTRAAGCAVGKDMGGGMYRCQANCGVTKSGKCLNYVHNSPDKNCVQCNNTTAANTLQTQPSQNSSTQSTDSQSNAIQVLAWNQSKMTPADTDGNVLIINKDDVYQVCMKYPGITSTRLLQRAYMLGNPTESVFYISEASSRISRNSNTDKIFGCTSIAVLHEESTVKQVALKGSIVLGETTPYEILKAPVITVKLN